MVGTDDVACIGAVQYLFNTAFHPLKRLPVAARCHGGYVLCVSGILVRVPCALPRLLNKIRRDLVSLDGKRVIGISGINFFNLFQIFGSALRAAHAGRPGEILQHTLAHVLPHQPQAVDAGRRFTTAEQYR